MLIYIPSRVCIASVVRLALIWNPKEKGNVKDISFLVVTASIQLGLATLCACLPTYGPLIGMVRRRATKMSSGGSTNDSARHKPRSRGWYGDASVTRDLENAPYRRVENDLKWHRHRTLITGNKNGPHELDAYPPHAIVVHKSVDIDTNTI
jgi:hypothetical protein